MQIKLHQRDGWPYWPQIMVLFALAEEVVQASRPSFPAALKKGNPAATAALTASSRAFDVEPPSDIFDDTLLFFVAC